MLTWSQIAQIPQYVAIEQTLPQTEIQLWLKAHNYQQDVTHSSVVASLRPLRIAIGLTSPPPPHATLMVTSAQQVLGQIRLRQLPAITNTDFYLFQTLGSTHSCLAREETWLYNIQRWWRYHRDKSIHNFKMTWPELQHLSIFYFCPRPVVLVTVQHENKGNIFPMDLIGSLTPRYFALALRHTSPAVELMKASARIAVSELPFNYKTWAYQLGQHHQKSQIDWHQLPFSVHPSPRFQLPIPTAAVTTQELIIEQTHHIGSHTLFITSPLDPQPPSRTLLCHRHGLYHTYLHPPTL